jgi:hypothetical protein
MPKYSRNVSIPGKSAQEIYDRVAADIEGFLSKTPIGKHEIERDSTGRKVRFKSAMASATLTCTEGQVQLDADLSLLAAPFKGKLDEGINKWISRAFGVQVS